MAVTPFTLSGSSTAASRFERFDSEATDFSDFWDNFGGTVFDITGTLDGVLTNNSGLITIVRGASPTVLAIDEIIYGNTSGSIFGFETDAIFDLLAGDVVSCSGQFTHDTGGTENFDTGFPSSEHSGLELVFNAAVVPEPSTECLATLTLSIVAMGRRRR